MQKNIGTKETIKEILRLYNEQSEKIEKYDMDVSSLFQILERDIFVGTTSKLFEQYKEMHHHDFYEVLYIRKGEFRFKVDNKIYTINPGDMILISPSTLHVLDNVSTIDCERVVLNFTDKYVSELSSKHTDLKLLFTLVDNTNSYCISFKNDAKRSMDFFIQSLIDTQFSENYGDDIIFQFRLIQILLLAYKTFIEQESTEIIYENPIVAKAIEFIQNNIDKTFIIEDIANFVNVSASTISHTFKDVTGTSIYKYITKKRMILAKQLIKENYSFSELYSMCGFNDYTSFFRAFKKEYGITPKDFQKRFQQ